MVNKEVVVLLLMGVAVVLFSIIMATVEMKENKLHCGEGRYIKSQSSDTEIVCSYIEQRTIWSPEAGYITENTHTYERYPRGK
jgi:hypothetical protein